MTSSRKYLLGSVVLLLMAAALLWFLPARWVLPWIQPRLHGVQLQQVGGSVWSGHADAVVSADGQTLGRLRWQLSRRALLGQQRLGVDFHGSQGDFSAALERLPGDEVEVRNASVRVASAAFGRQLSTPWGQWRGDLVARIPHAVLRAGWPMQLDASATWREVIVRTAQGDVALGEFQATAQARDGVISVQLHDAGGPLQANGDLKLSPLGWRLDATLRARQTDPALQRWLNTLATPAADGSAHIQRHGGLTGSMPALPTT